MLLKNLANQRILDPSFRTENSQRKNFRVSILILFLIAFKFTTLYPAMPWCWPERIKTLAKKLYKWPRFARQFILDKHKYKYMCWIILIKIIKINEWVCILLDAKKHTYLGIPNIQCTYTYNLFFETIVSKVWPSSSVLLIINISSVILLGSITWFDIEISFSCYSKLVT